MSSQMHSVENLLEGFVSMHDNLVLYKRYKIVTRLENIRNDSETVKIISGGGSGHEPAHAGFVGRGMLTTAVCGDLYASPSVTAIVNAILVTGDHNSKIIMVVKNYTGDRINFGLALEIAKNKYQYKHIRMILVDDDISIDQDNVKVSVGRRGLAGIVIVHKIIGAMAELKYKIDDIVNYIDAIVKTHRRLSTIGFTFKSSALHLCDIEIGKGIHGEPGTYTVQQLNDFEPIIDFLLEKFQASIPPSTSVVLLVNNLGGTSEFLMSIFNDRIIKRLSESYSIKYKLTGTFLTSLNNEGISVTLLETHTDWELLQSFLEHKTEVSSNVFGTNFQTSRKPSQIANDIAIEHATPAEPGYKLSDTISTLLKQSIIAACESLIANSTLLNRVDNEFGDGDTGTTLNTAATSILSAITEDQLEFSHPKLLFQRLSDIMQDRVGGTSGVIYSLYFQSISSVFCNLASELDVKTWTDALRHGNEVVMKYALSKEGDRTMLDPLIAGQRALETSTHDDNLRDVAKKFSEAVHGVAEGTKKMVPKSGRAAYSGNLDDNMTCVYPDPGAVAVDIWVKAIYKTIICSSRKQL